jgi:hypothetical protein
MIRPAFSLAVLSLAFIPAIPAAAAPESPTPANGKPIPLTDLSRFGPPQAQGQQTPQMKKLQDAGIYPGQTGSLTFLRWRGDNPPVVFHAGLWGNQITNEHAALLPSLPELESLTVYEGALDDAAAESLAKLPKLRRLSFAPVDRFQKNGFTRIQWSYPWLPTVENRPRLTGKALEALRALPLLDSLDLRDTRVRSTDLGVLASFAKLGEVGLPHPIDAETIRHLRACKSVGSLLLGDREISVSEIELLAGLPSLKRLTLRQARLSADALAAMEKLPKVTALTLYDCGITDAQLAQLGKPPSLTQLELVRNQIEGPGLARLTSFSLQKLELMMNNLSNASLPHLAALNTVEDLQLAYNVAITDAGIQSGILQGMKQLKNLEIRGLTGVTDASLKALSQFGHLKQIGIRETKISWESVDTMRAAMPETRVFK